MEMNMSGAQRRAKTGQVSLSHPTLPLSSLSCPDITDLSHTTRQLLAHLGCTWSLLLRAVSGLGPRWRSSPNAAPLLPASRPEV